MEQHPSGGCRCGYFVSFGGGGGYPGVKRWSEAQIGKPYRLFSHVFRPEFMKYNSFLCLCTITGTVFYHKFPEDLTFNGRLILRVEALEQSYDSCPFIVRCFINIQLSNSRSFNTSLRENH